MELQPYSRINWDMSYGSDRNSLAWNNAQSLGFLSNFELAPIAPVCHDSDYIMSSSRHHRRPCTVLYFALSCLQSQSNDNDSNRSVYNRYKCAVSTSLSIIMNMAKTWSTGMYIHITDHQSFKKTLTASDGDLTKSSSDKRLYGYCVNCVFLTYSRHAVHRQWQWY